MKPDPSLGDAMTGCCSGCRLDREVVDGRIAEHVWPYGTGAPPPGNYCHGSGAEPLAEPLTCRCGHHIREHFSNGCNHGWVWSPPRCTCTAFDGAVGRPERGNQ